jgi:O-antigen/teichoic acid export membrane protein
MKTLIKNTLHFLGFDRAVSFGVLARVWSLFAGPITIMIIASRFSEEQQGFYYTISSLLALQIFFELGLVTVLAQFASHEFAHLTWGDNGRIEGDPVARARLIELLCKATRWFGIAAILLITVLIPAGLVFLNQRHGSEADFSWRFPWILAVCGTAVNLLIIPFFAVVMGSGDVVTVNHREMLGAVVSSCICWIVIGLHGGLYAVFAITTGSIIVSCTYLVKEKPELLKVVWKEIFDRSLSAAKEGTISWWGEVWPMQWKIALSWVSGYFIFQLFNPVLFHYHGPVVAGQMGMTLSVSNALLVGCATLMNARSPEFGIMIARREWEQLDKMFNRVLWQSIGVVIVGAIVGWGVIEYLQKNYQIGQRFLPAHQAGFLFAAICVQIVINAFAIYLRAHKQEPFMTLFVLVALLQGTATWFFGMYYSSIGVTAGFLGINLIVTLPSAYFIWRRCKKLWHMA